MIKSAGLKLVIFFQYFVPYLFKEVLPKKNPIDIKVTLTFTISRGANKQYPI